MVRTDEGNMDSQSLTIIFCHGLQCLPGNVAKHRRRQRDGQQTHRQLTWISHSIRASSKSFSFLCRIPISHRSSGRVYQCALHSRWLLSTVECWLVKSLVRWALSHSEIWSVLVLFRDGWDLNSPAHPPLLFGTFVQPRSISNQCRSRQHCNQHWRCQAWIMFRVKFP